MWNPGGREFSPRDWLCFRKGRRDQRAAAKLRLKPARRKEESPPWSLKELSSPLGAGAAENWGRASELAQDRGIALKVQFDPFPPIVYIPTAIDESTVDPLRRVKWGDTLADQHRRRSFSGRTPARDLECSDPCSSQQDIEYDFDSCRFGRSDRLLSPFRSGPCAGQLALPGRLRLDPFRLFHSGRSFLPQCGLELRLPHHAGNGAGIFSNCRSILIE